MKITLLVDFRNIRSLICMPNVRVRRKSRFVESFEISRYYETMWHKHSLQAKPKWTLISSFKMKRARGVMQKFQTKTSMCDSYYSSARSFFYQLHAGFIAPDAFESKYEYKYSNVFFLCSWYFKLLPYLIFIISVVNTNYGNKDWYHI